MKTKKFLLLWAVSTVGILAYAVIDLLVNPQIQLETRMTVEPDISRLPALIHWGGRLIHHDRSDLLVLNAIFMGGFLTLVLSWVWGAFTKEKDENIETFGGEDGI